MLKFVLLLALSVALTQPAHSAKPIFPRMSGQDVVRMTASPPGVINGLGLTGQQYLDDQVAKGYIDGVQDATQGKDWCDTGMVKPHELGGSVILELRALPTERLKGSAAPLIVEVLRKKFPCRSET